MAPSATTFNGSGENNSQVLDCAVVGAGIAGLSSAIALRRAGHNVEIFEKSEFKNEAGAAITETPNANLVLDRWGFDAIKAQETIKRQARRLNAVTLECESRVDLDGVKERFGHAFNAFHREDLHNGLRTIVEDLGIVLRLGTAVTDVNCTEGLLKTVDGLEMHKDLIILADGASSTHALSVTGVSTEMHRIGKSVYRTLIPISKLMADPVTKVLYENEKSGFNNTILPATGQMLVTYPCRNDEVMNVALFHTTREEQKDRHDWNSPATVEDALLELKDFHPAWQGVIRHADFMKVYTLGFRPPVKTMIKGKAAIVGDAAHPMMPTHAQGGCMAIEDAASLEILFSNMSRTDTVEERLRLFQDLRLPRNVVTQILSNKMFYYEGMNDADDAIREQYSGRILKPGHHEGWTEEIREFFYSYDVFEEARKALQYKGQPGGVPREILSEGMFGLSK